VSTPKRGLFTRFWVGGGAVAGAGLAVLVGAIGFDDPKAPPPLAYVRDETVARDRSDLPAIRHYRARDGGELAYRAYPAVNPIGAAVLVHGSVGSSADVHEIAKALRDAGIDAYALDMRGHGASGPRGDVAYIGQLEDDLGDFLDTLDRQGAPARRVLIGHSAGGGFALRVVARPLGERFAGTILLAPFLGTDAPTTKPGLNDWAGVAMPRIVVLTILDKLGIPWFGGLPVVAFAVSAADAQYVTPTYSFRLAANFGPDRDWRRDIADAHRPLVVMAGDGDQVFHADGYEAAFAASPEARVEVLSGIDHMSLTGAPSALAAISDAARNLIQSNRR
jgi:alpha-beta hydrolase superfamily lysophospholipase